MLIISRYGKFQISWMQVSSKWQDIYKTKVCPLKAKVMRRELKKCGVKKLKVVYTQKKCSLRDRRKICRSAAVRIAFVHRSQA